MSNHDASIPPLAVDEDDIWVAIWDSMDMDWTARDGAKAVIELLRERQHVPAAPSVPTTETPAHSATLGQTRG